MQPEQLRIIACALQCLLNELHPNFAKQMVEEGCFDNPDDAQKKIEELQKYVDWTIKEQEAGHVQLVVE